MPAGTVAAAAAPEVAAKGMPSRGVAVPPAQAPASAARDAMPAGGASVENAAQASDDRRILRNADMAVAVTSVEEAAREARETTAPSARPRSLPGRTVPRTSLPEDAVRFDVTGGMHVPWARSRALGQ